MKKVPERRQTGEYAGEFAWKCAGKLVGGIGWETGLGRGSECEVSKLKNKRIHLVDACFLHHAAEKRTSWALRD